MEKVSILGCRYYNITQLDKVIEQHFVLLEVDGKLIKKDDKVAIKPNLLLKKTPEQATTTHPEFIAAIIRAVKRRGGIPIIAESPGGPYTKGNLKGVYSSTGMEEIALREGAQLNYDIGWQEVSAENYSVCSAFNIINPILEADVIISAAKLKTHGMMNYSGAVKNLFGVVPGLMKPEFHFRFRDKASFANMLVDLCQTVKPTISFIDGIMGMEGNGPSGGEPKLAGITAASKNPHALDLLCSRLIGMSVQEVYTVDAAIKRGLCPATIAELKIVGENAETLLCEFRKPETRTNEFLGNIKIPKFLRKPIENLLTPKPEIVKATCIGCAKCAESCPQHIISIIEHKAVIDYSKCIKCYCCHEMCPEKSIRIKTFRLFGW